MGVKPIFVFDGTPPRIKSETTRKRRERREVAEEEKKKARETLFQNLLKMHALKHVESESGEITDYDIDRMQRQLKQDEDLEEDFFISSDYKKEEIVSSDEEVDDEGVSATAEVLHQIIRKEFLASLTTDENVNVDNSIFNNLTYTDQLGILDDVREVYKFGRSRMNPFVS